MYFRVVRLPVGRQLAKRRRGLDLLDAGGGIGATADLGAQLARTLPGVVERFVGEPSDRHAAARGIARPPVAKGPGLCPVGRDPEFESLDTSVRDRHTILPGGNRDRFDVSGCQFSAGHEILDRIPGSHWGPRTARITLVAKITPWRSSWL